MLITPTKSPPSWRQVAASLAVSLALLTACTGPAPTEPTAPTGSAEVNAVANDVDLHFAETMPGHHDQAIEMSKMLLGKTGLDPDVRAIAEDIQTVHAKQLKTMTSWADTWAFDTAAHTSDAPDADETGVGHHGGQGGLMTEDQMRDLDLAEGPNAETMYLDGMIRHHQGALTMAEEETKDGKTKTPSISPKPSPVPTPTSSPPCKPSAVDGGDPWCGSVRRPSARSLLGDNINTRRTGQASVCTARHDGCVDSIYLSPAHVRLPMATERDLDAALDAGLLEENHFLDLQREVKSGKAPNKETARDLAQFAIDGGTVLVGIDELDDGT